MADKVKCNQCGHIGPESEFRTGTDFFQRTYISGCPKCDNRQNPGDASMRMVGGERPFTYIRAAEPEITGSKIGDAVPAVLRRAEEAS